MYSVVLIDDEHWTLVGISNTFLWEENNFKLIYKTTNPKDALKYILKNKPDVVFTDIRMPELDGIELMEKIREKNDKTEFVIISGFAEFKYAQEAIRQGAFDYCLKPIEDEKANDILIRLKHHLDMKNNIIRNKNYNGTNYEFKQIIDYINENYMKKIQLKTIANRFYMNASYLSQLFSKELNTTFTKYLIEVRMNEVIKIIGDISITMEDVATRVGYDDYYYFNKVFKKHFGVTPYQYRKQILK